MMFTTTTLFAAALATLSPMNAPSLFGTETEQTFALPAQGDQPVAAWSSARVRVSGPRETAASISARRSRYGFVFTVR